jgi:Nuclear condensing complex subunits, C-term domain
MLSEYITHIDCSIRAIAVEALARLLFSRKVSPSPKLLSRLLMAYYNPVNEGDEHLRQCLSVFFPAFAFSSPHHRLALEAAFLPTLHVLGDAPLKSPLSQVHPLIVAQFMLHLTNPSSVPASHLKENGSCKLDVDVTDAAGTTHERIAESLLHLTLDLDANEEVSETSRLYAKILSAVRLVASVHNRDELQRLRTLSASAMANLQDKRTLTQIRKFYEHISSIIGEDEVSEGGERCHTERAGRQLGGKNQSDSQDLNQEEDGAARERDDDAEFPRHMQSREKTSRATCGTAPLAERVTNLSQTRKAYKLCPAIQGQEAVAKDSSCVVSRPTRRAAKPRQSYVEESDASESQESEDDSYKDDGMLSDS